MINLAANPDLSLSNSEPTIDFNRGTVVHNHVLELCRIGQARQLIFTSGSGVYGDMASQLIGEDLGLLNVCSPYGANKLACEALSMAYCKMFGLDVRILRFGNVVGMNQTHGVAFDFINRLVKNPTKIGSPRRWLSIKTLHLRRRCNGCNLKGVRVVRNQLCCECGY